MSAAYNTGDFSSSGSGGAPQAYAQPVQAHAQAEPVQVNATAVDSHPPIPIHVQGQAQLGTCRDCRQQYAIRHGENDADAAYFRCVSCARKTNNSQFFFGVLDGLCSIQ
jgi:hypothetical protein